MPEHRKRVKHYHEPGDLHELTFSCYQRMPLLTNDTWRRYLSDSIGSSCREQRFRLVAFVFMPEHVHLIVDPLDEEPDIGTFLAAVKRPVSARVKQTLVQRGSRLLEKLTILERPGKTVFRFWQEGPGYDRNLQQERTALSAIDYVHMNPVRRRLVERASLWKWSSARWYETDRQHVDVDLPEMHGLRPGFFVG
ncbi:MAG: hypothetical protein DWQ45_05595 [Planctomycetota bacterium]|nr:MAG: hypothetical protein DWQ41_23955 [Planctomycetota bacterium]REK38113.1 MAG: hypothetical protein DWQ45_05595 [Planctomycetota bacterium]